MKYEAIKAIPKEAIALYLAHQIDQEWMSET
jgi:hypothetical protein